nr:hypothetical protein P5627_14585 [Bacillus safensis]
MNKEDLQKMLEETIAPVVKRLDDLEEGEGEDQPDPQKNKLMKLSQKKWYRSCRDV